MRILAILWKIYFWFMCFAFVVVYAKEGAADVFDAVDIFITVFALAGLFGYCYKKNLFAAYFWKIFLPVCIGWDLLYNLSIRRELVLGEYGLALFAVAFLLSVPVYIALYFYAYINDDFVKQRQ